ncbi:MAG TPA: maleylpyruvate isomerase family mycothiol-dependent enzyme [Anaerolineaceae bacterium]|nr:maleylpyruvate isomerase family mycothiol-dependent enzyme [Anaerolineaceae bacterium]
MISGTTTHTNIQTTPNALDIPDVTADEAYKLLETEFDRFNKLLEKIKEDDWQKPTACTAWNVKDMLAHQAGGYASGTGYREMIRQYTSRPKPGQLPEDAINDLQVNERQHNSPAEIISELRTVGPTAIQKWSYQFRIGKFFTDLIKVPHPVGGKTSLCYLMWVIHSRDTWMHRLDICRATGNHFEQTAQHDGRIVALVMRDVAEKIIGKLAGKTILFELTGIPGGIWKVGNGDEVARLRIDALDFNIFVSGRFSYDVGLSHAELSGDSAFLKEILKDLLILF